MKASQMVKLLAVVVALGATPFAWADCGCSNETSTQPMGFGENNDSQDQRDIENADPSRD